MEEITLTVLFFVIYNITTFSIDLKISFDERLIDTRMTDLISKPAKMIEADEV